MLGRGNSSSAVGTGGRLALKQRWQDRHLVEPQGKREEGKSEDSSLGN